jgi:hypothetical protein
MHTIRNQYFKYLTTKLVSKRVFGSEKKMEYDSHVPVLLDI